jgi:23S rRNA pseudouridine2457 synthase
MSTQQHHYYWFYKPFNVLCQFSPEGDKTTLATYFNGIPQDVYPVGRLDYDSEGLILLTNDKRITTQLLHPKYQHQRTYWVQVEGVITEDAIHKLQAGVTITVNGKKHQTLPCIVKKISDPALPERNPPIRFRKNIPTSWISITLTEGKNRQVRKMTATVGYPTLRLVRYSIGNYTLENLIPGKFKHSNAIDEKKLKIKQAKVTLPVKNHFRKP